MENIVQYSVLTIIALSTLGLIIFGVAKAGVDLYTLFVGLNVFLVAAGLVVGGVITLKDAAEAPTFTWQVARASIVYLPISLAMFSVFGSVIFENSNFLIPVLVGIGAVGMNFVLDVISTRSGLINTLWWLFTRPYVFIMWIKSFITKTPVA